MKTRYLSLCLAASLAATASEAQTIPTAVPPVAVGTSSGVTKVSNDTRNVDVVAWDGSNPALIYKPVGPSGTPTTISLPAGFRQPDVVVCYPASIANGDTYLLVAGILNNSFVLYRYLMPNGSSTFSLVNTNLIGFASGSLPPSINLDADFNGNFAMVVGNPNGAIRVYSGTFSMLSLGTPWNVNGTLALNTGQQVDVCLSNDPFAVPTNIHLSYLDPGSSRVYTNSIPFTTGGSFSGPVVAASGGVYKSPRIACPMTNQCTTLVSDHFSIIYNEIIGSDSHIGQYNNNPDGSINTTYPTSGAAPFPTPGFTNVAGTPVITFTKNLMGLCYSATASAWEMPGTTPASLTGERINTNNTPYGTADYLGITTSAMTGARLLAISGRNGSGNLPISFWWNGSIYYKSVVATGTTF